MLRAKKLRNQRNRTAIVKSRRTVKKMMKMLRQQMNLSIKKILSSYPRRNAKKLLSKRRKKIRRRRLKSNKSILTNCQNSISHLEQLKLLIQNIKSLCLVNGGKNLQSLKSTLLQRQLCQTSLSQYLVSQTMLDII